MPYVTRGYQYQGTGVSPSGGPPGGGRPPGQEHGGGGGDGYDPGNGGEEEDEDDATSSSSENPGFLGYYQKFIPRYSDMARPLTNLTCKDKVFDWSGTCQEAFEMLKEALIKEPILKYPNPSKLSVLYTDASK